MASKKTEEKPSKSRLRPAITPEAREAQLIALAYQNAEERLLNGTASNQLIIEFLKRESAKERLEKEKLERENELLTAKTEAIKSAKKVEELYSKALSAMRVYKGEGNDGEAEDL